VPHAVPGEAGIRGARQAPRSLVRGAASGEPAATGMFACPDDSRFVAAVAYEIDADGR